VGSNASALEATFNIMDISGMDDLINKFYFLSRDGAFPYRSNEGQINLDDNNLPALNSLKNASKVTSKQILEAVKRMSKNEILKVNIAEITDHMSKIINGLLVKLSI
jgi:uncharacterized protein (DUF2267 family)